MGGHHKRRFWRVCRIYFRRFRISAWLIILAVLAGLVYVNQIGLPDFLKGLLVDKLRARGLDLQFSRLRLSWHQGVVAENVHFGPADRQSSPQLNVAEVQVLLNWSALAHLQLQIDSLVLRRGRVFWALESPNEPSRELSVANIQTDLRFLPNDEWALDNFRAQFAGANIQLSGVVTNASAIRDWKIFQGQGPPSRSTKLWQSRLRRLADTLNQIHFASPPALRVHVVGDGLDLHTFNVLLFVSAPGAETPWGEVAEGRFSARLFSVDSNGVSRAELDLHAAGAQTPWGAVTNSSLAIHLASVESQANLVDGKLRLSAETVNTRWARGSNALFTATWVHAITNPIPISGQGSAQCDLVETPWGSAKHISFGGNLVNTNSKPAVASDSSWGWWTNLEPYELSWDCRLTEPKVTNFEARSLSCAGNWAAPQLTVTNLEAQVFQGQCTARAELNVATRLAHLKLDSECDLHGLSPHLPHEIGELLNQFSWETPPRIALELSARLPDWTESQPNWTTNLLASANLSGEVSLDRGGAFRGVAVESAHTHFFYSNQFLNIPDLTLVRPEGSLNAEHQADPRSGAFYWRVSSRIDPAILRPFLDESTQRAFDLVAFSQPPSLEMELWGQGTDASRTGLRGQLSVSNFTFRGESFRSLETQVSYTNGMIRVLQPRVEIPSGKLSADGLAVDLGAQFAYLTNGFSTADPMIVARVIGPHVARDIEPYTFGSPPKARISGAIPLHGEDGADLHFDLMGGPFHWWKINVPHITGHVHWAGKSLTLTNVQAEFYHGLADGHAEFDFSPEKGTDFQFTLNTTNVLLQSLMADLSPSTNQPEGRLNGTLVISKANSENWQTVFGYGEAHLRDGLLWDIPLFGIFSPILNGIIPGLGNSRASAATASYIITNGVIRSSDFEIRSTGMRLQYRGTVNLESQLNARVDAELLRDMWLVGPLVSTVFWPVTKLFEYRVSGTLAEPRTEPVFILPKIMLLPFHPIRTLKGLKPEDPNTDPNFSPLPP